MPKTYELPGVEIHAPMACFVNHPDSGSEQSTSVVVPLSAAKGMFENILFLRHALVRPTKLHVCAPIQTMQIGFNYVHGPLRKDNDKNIQYRLMVLAEVKYQLFAEVTNVAESTARYASAKSLPHLNRINHAHSYQAQFERHLRRGSFYRPVVLGKSFCMPTYVGPLLPETKPCEDISMTIPILLNTPFTSPMFGKADFKQTKVFKNIEVKNGVMLYV